MIFSSVIKDANPFTLFNPAKELDQCTSIEYTCAAYSSEGRSIGVQSGQRKAKTKWSEHWTTHRPVSVYKALTKQEVNPKKVLYSYSLLWFSLFCRMKIPLPFRPIIRRSEWTDDPSPRPRKGLVSQMCRTQMCCWCRVNWPSGKVYHYWAALSKALNPNRFQCSCFRVWMSVTHPGNTATLPV